EYSTRYSEAIDDKQETDFSEWRAQSSINKQGSEGSISWPENEDDIVIPGSKNSGAGVYLSARERDFHRSAQSLYRERLAFGVAREQARKDLPLSTYTEAYWKIDLHNLLHFLRLRMDSHAQLEIRQYANAIAEVVKE
ncbi:FAD-dependent thymidylate synthase, partial [Mangrovimonas sp. AS39]|uniref:FAD-dependent thymidylate synthase n=1 Tax=Mangrovimonas futianensis TaxID=2895523 RepID=UPI001E474F26